MSAPLWVIEAAEHFWETVGDVEAFPRNLRNPIALVLPVAVVSLPRLRLGSIDEWLRRHSLACELPLTDRSVRACLVARNGHAIIFLDGVDAEAEQRFSLAHELAHFLRHYDRPRRRVAERLGERGLEVLDGRRPPDRSERVDAILSQAPLGFHVHLLERDQDGGIVRPLVAEAEREADLLAFELLAPAGDVLAGVPPADNPRALVRERLVADFGFPAGAADHYSQLLVPSGTRRSALLERLGFVP